MKFINQNRGYNETFFLFKALSWTDLFADHFRYGQNHLWPHGVFPNSHQYSRGEVADEEYLEEDYVLDTSGFQLFVVQLAWLGNILTNTPNLTCFIQQTVFSFHTKDVWAGWALAWLAKRHTIVGIEPGSECWWWMRCQKWQSCECHNFLTVSPKLTFAANSSTKVVVVEIPHDVVVVRCRHVIM